MLVLIRGFLLYSRFTAASYFHHTVDIKRHTQSVAPGAIINNGPYHDQN